MKHRATATFGSLAVHAALLGLLSAAVTTIPVQTSFQKGRAVIELQASLAAAPRDESQPTPELEVPPEPVTEESRAPDLQPTDTSLERRPAGPVMPQKPDAEPAPLAEASPEPVVVASAARQAAMEAIVFVQARPPKQKPSEAQPREVVEAPVESVAAPASRAEAGVEYDEPPHPHPLNRQPPYPTEARARGQEGTVVLHLHVTTSGAVGDVRIARSSGVASLDEAAIAAARQWRYTPARRGNTSVAMTFEARVNFYFSRG